MQSSICNSINKIYKQNCQTYNEDELPENQMSTNVQRDWLSSLKSMFYTTKTRLVGIKSKVLLA